MQEAGQALGAETAEATRAGDTEALTEIFDLVRGMRVHLQGEELSRFDAAVAGRHPIEPGVQGTGQIAASETVAPPTTPAGGGMSWKWAIRTAVLVVVALVVVGAIRNPFHFGSSSGPSPGDVASIAGMDYCDNSGYYLESKITGSKQTIYDCMKGAKAHCVTMSGGIATDSTEEVRLLFAQTLGGSKPSCLAGYATAG